MSHTVLEPELANTSSLGSGRWMVTIYNNAHNSMDEVVEVLMLATGCDVQEAVIEMWEAHTFGKAPVHFAPKSVCDEAAATISSVGIKTEVSREWKD